MPWCCLDKLPLIPDLRSVHLSGPCRRTVARGPWRADLRTRTFARQPVPIREGSNFSSLLMMRQGVDNGMTQQTVCIVWLHPVHTWLQLK